MSGVEAPFCTVEREGKILIVTMNRPESLNAFPPGAHDEMEKIFDDFAADDSLHVAILTGAGRAFCAGSNLKAYDAGYTPVMPKTGGAGILKRRGLRKPIIGAAPGLALGGGFEVLLACDLVVAAEGAFFGLPEPQVGAGATGGGIPHLVRKLPHAIAMSILIAGERLSVDDAYRFGLVNEIAPKGEVLAVARKWAEKILKSAPTAMRCTKYVADLALLGASDEELHHAEDEVQIEIWNSPDRVEGMRAFVEKRPPNWG